MKKKGGKIEAIKREKAECEVLMKTFCLNPSPDVYQRISKCDGVTRSEYYGIWKAMLPYSCVAGAVAGAGAGVKPDAAPTNEEATAAYNTKRDLVYKLIDQKLATEPNKVRAMQMLYIFAATGWFTPLERFYELMGDHRIGHPSRVEMSVEYKYWKELYSRKIHELLSVNKNHFEERGIDKSTVDFTRFDIYQREYEEKKRAKEEDK